MEVWLRPNRRAIAFALLLPLGLAVVGAWLIVSNIDESQSMARWVGATMALAGAIVSGILIARLRRPRIAYDDGSVLFYLRARAPVTVPIGIVEAFFLGQGPAELPGGFGQGEETVNLVARLAQRETDWASRDVEPALGRWCGGYITIRGTWCEPLGTAVIRRLNQRLKELQTR
jgi:hypothetical protein